MQELPHPLVPILIQLLRQTRHIKELTLEEVADAAQIHRTYLSLLERGDRIPTINVVARLADALEQPLSQIIQTAELISTENHTHEDLQRQKKARELNVHYLQNGFEFEQFCGLKPMALLQTIQNCYQILDTIDLQLKANDSLPIAHLVELANLSSMVGNLLGSGLAKNSDGLYTRNKPHTYPDLVPQKTPAINLELKMALEKNRPKGHLPKAGNYITFRYVLGDPFGNYTIGKEHRGHTVWIWEVKIGYLTEQDFDISNTEGDSGKTAVIKTHAFNNMTLVFFDPRFLPYTNKTKYYNQYLEKQV